MNFPQSAAFDGQRILITNPSGGSVCLFKAADLTPLTSVGIGGVSPDPYGACSDGVYFWITLFNNNLLARF